MIIITTVIIINYLHNNYDDKVVKVVNSTEVKVGSRDHNLVHN